MTSNKYGPDSEQVINIRTVALGAAFLLGVVALVFCFLLMREIRLQNEIHTKEINLLKSQHLSLVESVTVERERAVESEKRRNGYVSLEFDRQKERAEVLEREINLMPKIGQSISVKGRVTNAKMGWYVGIPLTGMSSSMALRLRETEAPSFGNERLNRYAGKVVVITGPLRFGQPTELNEKFQDCLYLDLAECKIEEEKDLTN